MHSGLKNPDWKPWLKALLKMSQFNLVKLVRIYLLTDNLETNWRRLVRCHCLLVKCWVGTQRRAGRTEDWKISTYIHHNVFIVGKYKLLFLGLLGSCQMPASYLFDADERHYHLNSSILRIKKNLFRFHLNIRVRSSGFQPTTTVFQGSGVVHHKLSCTKNFTSLYFPESLSRGSFY